MTALAPVLPAQAQTQDVVEFTIDQARGLAIDALNAGDPGLAIQLAKGLLKSDPKDHSAYFIIATGYSRLNDPYLARRAAALSYRYAGPGPERFHAAQLASQMAFAGGNYSLSQLWLRRTAIHAPTEQDKELVARDYKLLRRINPWSLRIRSEIRPSDNVNNGTDNALSIIDGVPEEGSTISGSSRALSGLIGTLDIAPSYRLRTSEASTTSLSGRLYIERVTLSSAAQDIAPDNTASDFASTYGELALSHFFAVGPPDEGGTASVRLAVGDSWYGGERRYLFARLEGGRSWVLANKDRLSLSADVEQRYRASSRTNDAWVLGLGAQYSTALSNGNTLGLSFALRDTNAQNSNGTYSSASMRTTYTLGRSVGPTKLSFGLVLGYTHYGSYDASFLFDGTQRTDKSIYGDVTFTFDEYDYAGFVPTLRLRTGRKKSNFSLFSSREVSVSLGVGSKF